MVYTEPDCIKLLIPDLMGGGNMQLKKTTEEKAQKQKSKNKNRKQPSVWHITGILDDF